MQKAAKYLRKKTASVKRTRANFAQVEGQTRHKNNPILLKILKYKFEARKWGRKTPEE